MSKIYIYVYNAVDYSSSLTTKYFLLFKFLVDFSFFFFQALFSVSGSVCRKVNVSAHIPGSREINIPASDWRPVSDANASISKDQGGALWLN